MPTLLTLFVNALPPPARRRLVRADPGMLRTARATRAMFAFLLTLAGALLVGRIGGAPVTSFLIGFPVTVFCCAAIGDDETRARAGKIAALAAAAGISFTVSAFIHTPWINHAVFVLVIGAAAYMRQYGGPWIPVGLAANVSYFFGAFLKPDPTTLHWQWAGVVIGAASALVIHQLVVPHRPWRRMRWSAAAIRMRLADLLRVAAALEAPGESLAVRKALRRVADAVTIAETELENLDGGRLAHRPLAEALIRALVLAERLALQTKGVIGAGLHSDQRQAATRLAAALTANAPLPREGDLADLADAVDELEGALRLPPDHDAARSVAPPATPPTAAILRPAVQSAAAAALAIAGGAALSPDRWYWAVITVFVMFTGTFSRGQALMKSLQRTFGTLAGILVAMGIVWLLHGDTRAALVLMPIAIFCVFYAFIQAYTWMAFWITVVVGLLFSVTGRFSDQLMVLRLEETAIGAAAGVIVATLVLPRRTDVHARDQFNALAEAVGKVIDEALPGGALNRLTLTAAIHDFEGKLASLRDAIEPLRLVPLSRATEQRSRLHRQLVLTSYWVHEVALAARHLDSAGVARAPAPAIEAATALKERLARLRDAGHRPDATAPPRDNPPQREPSDPARALEAACHGVAEALTAAARLLTDRSQQTRAFRF
ncbi:FUSC family protein [Stakelama saccharophila]|uniref:FUSC family protein n=1 Tax=Stakelama saccharophila TaxID=3075605 RepID=A0ABZ0BC51_9SPHN|nr:FUSC family protein [Stakelama sp. W311]WNO54640.1 FUSC family protein [Stakelama sp. W311]